MYILMKTSVGSVKEVRMFLEKSTDVFGKKYGRFWEKVRTFLGKSTDVFLRHFAVFVYR